MTKAVIHKPIMTGRETAPIYFNNIIVLFIGGFMIALTMEAAAAEGA